MTRFGPSGIFMAAAVLAAASLFSQDAAAQTQAPGAKSAAPRYELGPQDKLRIKVFEWRASLDQIFAWEAFNADYVVGPSGQLALPLVGELPVAGLTTEALSKFIGDELRKRMGLAAPPDTSIEVVEYRPFYVVGHIEKPGQYPFRPGMTVLQALSIGGGLLRARDAALHRLQRDAITQRGEYDTLLAELDVLLARSGRLESELASAREITFPDILIARQDELAVSSLMRQEQLVFEARLQALETQTRALTQLKDYLSKETESIKAQRDVHDTQVRLVTAELDKVRRLAAQGLTTSPRQLELERVAAQLASDGLKLDGGLIRVQQDISRTELSLIELRNTRSGDITVELQKTKAELDLLDRKKNTAAKLLYEAEVVAPGLLIESEASSASASVSYKIVRAVNDRVVELAAQEISTVLPGDTVKIEIASQKPRTAGSGLSSRPAAPKLYSEDRQSRTTN